MKLKRVKPLSTKHKATLEAFLHRSEHPEGTLTYRETQGFLFTVACAPDLVRPAEWLPQIFAGGEPTFEDSYETESIMGSLIGLFNENAPPSGKRDPRLPSDCAFREEIMANLEPDAPLAQWCRGFVIGHSWMENSWTARLPQEWEGDLGSITLTLSFFSSRAIAEAFLEEAGTPDTSLEEMALSIRDVFPRAIVEYSEMGDGLYKEQLRKRLAEKRDSAAPAPPSRNDPCTCGSGRKYKKCCGAPMN